MRDGSLMSGVHGDGTLVIQNYVEGRNDVNAKSKCWLTDRDRYKTGTAKKRKGLEK